MNARFPFALVACSTMFAASAQPPAAGSESLVTKEELAARFPELDPKHVAEAPVPGFFEAVAESNVAYFTKDGHYLFRGEIVDLTSQKNLTEERRARSRAEAIATMDPTKEIVFAPPSGKVTHRVFVFTDVDCGYCRQFHRQIKDVTALGIEVHYIPYPRTGPNTKSWERAEGVWCSADRHTALTEAKLGKDIGPAPACNAAVAEGYDLGRRVGLTGTPGVYSETGVDLGGYVPALQLLTRLEQAEPTH